MRRNRFRRRKKAAVQPQPVTPVEPNQGLNAATHGNVIIEAVEFAITEPTHERWLRDEILRLRRQSEALLHALESIGEGTDLTIVKDFAKTVHASHMRKR